MKKRNTFFFLVLFLLIVFRVMPQNAATQNAAAQKAAAQKAENSKNSPVFLLMPILETAFSGSVLLYPGNNSGDIPPDALFLTNGKKPELIELSCGDYNLKLRRDKQGRFVEFPFFNIDNYAQVTAAFSAVGALQKLSVTVKNYTSQNAGKNKDTQEPEQTLEIEFPVGFLPYSELSPGGSFPPVKVKSGEDIFYVFVFESPLFLTETWYNVDGEMLAFCKATVNNDKGAWRIISLQIHGGAEVKFEDRFFNSFDYISEIQFDDEIITYAFYNFLDEDVRLTFWGHNDFQSGLSLKNELVWDAAGLLRTVRATGESEDAQTEYRYEYELDSQGNWIKRLETAYAFNFDLLVPRPSLSRGVWNRRIVYGD